MLFIGEGNLQKSDFCPREGQMRKGFAMAVEILINGEVCGVYPRDAIRLSGGKVTIKASDVRQLHTYIRTGMRGEHDCVFRVEEAGKNLRMFVSIDHVRLSEGKLMVEGREPFVQDDYMGAWAIP